METINDAFNGLFEKDLLQAFKNEAILKSFKEGTIILKIGQEASHLPLVVNGSLKILTADKEGDTLLLYFLEWGETCVATLDCCLKNQNAVVHAVAETDVQILLIPKNKIESWMIKYNSWRKYVLASFNDRFKELIHGLNNVIFNNMEHRVFNYLRDKALVNQKMILNISHRDIADDLHSSRVVITRIMKKLEQAGEIIQERNKIELIRLDKLYE